MYRVWGLQLPKSIWLLLSLECLLLLACIMMGSQQSHPLPVSVHSEQWSALSSSLPAQLLLAAALLWCVKRN